MRFYIVASLLSLSAVVCSAADGLAVTTYAGTEFPAAIGNNTPARSAYIQRAISMVYARNGDLVIADRGAGAIRTVSAVDHMIREYELTIDAPDLNDLRQITFDPFGNLVVINGLQVIKFQTIPDPVTGDPVGNPTVLAGYAGKPGKTPATQYVFSNPVGVAVDAANNVYIADDIGYDNNGVSQDVILKVTGDNITELVHAGNIRVGSADHLSGGRLAINAKGMLYVAETQNNVVSQIDPVTGARTIIAGTQMGGYGDFGGDGDLATKAKLSYPTCIAFDAAGNLLISDSMNGRIRKVDMTSNIITTIAGGGTCLDNNPPRSVFFPRPEQVAVSVPFYFQNLSVSPRGDNPVPANNDIAISDAFDTRIRVITATSAIAADDTDGDGFSNLLENAAGTSATDASSRPVTRDDYGAGRPFLVQKALIKLNPKRTNADKVEFSLDGIPIEQDMHWINIKKMNLAKKKLTFDFNGKLVRSFTLNRSGSGKIRGGTVKVIQSNTAPKWFLNFHITLTNGNFHDLLTNVGSIDPVNKQDAYAAYIVLVFNDVVYVQELIFYPSEATASTKKGKELAKANKQNYLKAGGMWYNADQ